MKRKFHVRCEAGENSSQEGMPVTYRYYSIAEANVGINQRKLGDTIYTVYPQTMAEVTYDFQPGIFLRVPVTHFDHVMDKGNVNAAIAGKKSEIPINLENE